MRSEPSSERTAEFASESRTPPPPPRSAATRQTSRPTSGATPNTPTSRDPSWNRLRPALAEERAAVGVGRLRSLGEQHAHEASDRAAQHAARLLEQTAQRPPQLRRGGDEEASLAVRTEEGREQLEEDLTTSGHLG